MNRTYKSPRRDHLTLTTQGGKIELTEEELTRVTGGARLEYLKIKMQEVLISGVNIGG
jgi:hypothetical protein